MSRGDRAVVGWREYVSLPEWGVVDLKAKIDTGARTSAIHVEDVVELPDGRIRFDVVLSLRYRHKRVTVEADVKRRSHVRSSTGDWAPRYFVETLMVLGPVRKTIEVSLVKRDQMRVRMLVGRTALADDFWVDANAVHLTGRSGL